MAEGTLDNPSSGMAVISPKWYPQVDNLGNKTSKVIFEPPAENTSAPVGCESLRGKLCPRMALHGCSGLESGPRCRAQLL